MAEQTEKPEWWDQAKKELSEADPVMAQIIRANPEGFLATRGNPFETLLRSVIGQQISVKAAANIWERFAKACKEIKPEIITRKHRRTLRTAGLSERKIEYVFDICRFFLENPDAADGFQHRSNEEIIKELCTIKGVGPWDGGNVFDLCAASSGCCSNARLRLYQSRRPSVFSGDRV